MKVMIVDNVDSFVYNLYQYVGELGAEPVVVPNTITMEEIVESIAPDRIILSPGPGKPEDAGHCVDIIRELGPTIPTMGVCLGHQCIGIAFGGTVSRAPAPMHGKTSVIRHDGEGIYAGLGEPITATRYHSLAIKRYGFPAELKVTAVSCGRGDHGRAPPGISHRGRPVPPRVHPDGAGQEADE